MCYHVLYHDPSCGHTWAAIAMPCGPGMGFTTCPTFFRGTDRAVYPAPPLRQVARPGLGGELPCPVCDLAGLYDRNAIRRVRAIRRGVKIGAGPGRQDCGVEVRSTCVLM